MTSRGLILGALVCAPMLVGCDASSGELEDAEFRAAASERDEWWAPDPANPGDGDIEVREGGDDDLPDIIIWDIDGGHVTRDESGTREPRFVVQGNELWSASGGSDGTALASAGPICTVVQADHPSDEVFQLVDAEQEVVFTMVGRLVVAGDVEPSAKPRFRDLAASAVVSFQGRRIYDGDWRDREALATADAPIAGTNPVRRLLLAAMVTGECGA